LGQEVCPGCVAKEPKSPKLYRRRVIQAALLRRSVHASRWAVQVPRPKWSRRRAEPAVSHPDTSTCPSRVLSRPNSQCIDLWDGTACRRSVETATESPRIASKWGSRCAWTAVSKIGRRASPTLCRELDRDASCAFRASSRKPDARPRYCQWPRVWIQISALRNPVSVSPD
jgi:hypothetical protein